MFKNKQNCQSLMLQGTGSGVGKSLITTGLCRLFSRNDFSVAPFKSQNMALNSYITWDGKEMGRAQVVQAEAAGLIPDVRMNPILLKPSSDQKSQLIVMGKAVGNYNAFEYHQTKAQYKSIVKEAYNSLADENDIVFIEGAGSPAEINLMEHDFVNMGMAELADSSVILVGDIEKGGVFASLYGTVKLLPTSQQERVKGIIINKFRGDKAILQPGIDQLERMLNIPVIGVLPYQNFMIDDEDSLAPSLNQSFVSNSPIKIAVIKNPKISNFTDFTVFQSFPKVSLGFYDQNTADLLKADIIILPGSKNTIEDLQYMKKTGMDQTIQQANQLHIPIIGICGGYQMLGEWIDDPFHMESNQESISGLGLLKGKTKLNKNKRTLQSEANIIKNNIPDGFFSFLKEIKSSLIGYEVHCGHTTAREHIFHIVHDQLIESQRSNDGNINTNGNVLGTYLHGIFDNIEFTFPLLNNLLKKKNMPPLARPSWNHFQEEKMKEYDKLASFLEKHIQLQTLHEIIKK